MFPKLVVSLAAALVACTPLVRFGDIEPSEGGRALVDVQVKPKRDGRVGPDELAAVVGERGIGVLATEPLPVVDSDVAANEMASNVQGLDVPADEALVDEALIATDARRLESIYAARGYFKAKNIGHLIEERTPDQAALEVDVLEGVATTVSEIRFLGACERREDPDAEKLRRLRRICRELRDLIPMRKGDVWTEEAYLTGLDQISRAFRSEGLLHARVSGDNWVSRDRHIVAVWYDIDEGPLVRVLGEVLVEGNARVDTARIRERIDIREGDIIDDELLRETERNVQDLGPFFSVQANVVRESLRDEELPNQAPGPVPTSQDPEVIDPGPVGAPSDAPPVHGPGPLAPPPVTLPPEGPAVDAPPVVPGEERKEARPERMQVKVQVAEAPLWELTIGPSVITDFLRLDLALPIAFTHRNLFNEVVALQAQARPALVLPDCFTGEACFSGPEFGLDSKLGIQVPSFFEEYLRLSIDGSYKRDPTQDVQTEEIVGSLGLSRRLAEGLTARVGYNVGVFNYFGTGALRGLKDAEALDTSALRFVADDFIAWFDAALVLDLRDSPLESRNGAFLSLAAQFAGAWSGSQVPYTRLLGDVRLYFTPQFVEWLTLAARLEVGWNFFDSAIGTPLSARFKSGGATSHRGFATDRIGDYVCAKPDDAGGYINNPQCGNGASDRTYIGGNYVIESNFELRFHLRGGIGLVWFADVGRVWSTDPKLGDLYMATGPGFRYELPVGPIRFDIGFLLGRDRDTQLHFSLGQAF